MRIFSGILVLLIMMSGTGTYAQSLEELHSINSKSKVQFVPPETLDMLMISLRGYDNSEDSAINTLLLETYLSISNGYMANNHYKRAFEVYYKFLIKKESMMTKDKVTAINNASQIVSEKRGSDEKEELELKNQVDQLTADNNGLESKRLSFKRNVSFALIVLSSIFAIMLVSAGIRMMSIRGRLRQSRDRMKKIHRVALIGSFDEGLRKTLKENIVLIEAQSVDLQQGVKKSEAASMKQVNQLLSGADKIVKDLKGKI